MAPPNFALAAALQARQSPLYQAFLRAAGPAPGAGAPLPQLAVPEEAPIGTGFQFAAPGENSPFSTSPAPPAGLAFIQSLRGRTQGAAAPEPVAQTAAPAGANLAVPPPGAGRSAPNFGLLAAMNATGMGGAQPVQPYRNGLSQAFAAAPTTATPGGAIAAPISADFQGVPRPVAPGAGRGAGSDTTLAELGYQTPQPPAPSAALQQARAQLDAMSKPLTFKQKLLRLAANVAPIALGGAFGGLTGAGGAAEGVNQANQLALQVAQQRRGQLLGEISQEEDAAQKQYATQVAGADAAARILENANYHRLLTDTSSQRATQQYLAQLERIGMKPGPDGTPVPDPSSPNFQRLDAQTQGYLQRVPVLASQRALNDARTELASAQAALAQAKNDPSSPLFQQAQQRLTLAQANVASRNQGLSYAKVRLIYAALDKSPALLNDPELGLTPEQIASYAAALPHDPATGALIGFQDPRAPTNLTRSRGQQAQEVLPNFDAAMTQIRALTDQLGPMAGRWNNLMAGKGGFADPAFSTLRANLDLIKGAYSRFHLNTEMGYSNFDALLAASQSPENLLASLGVMKSLAERYAASGAGSHDVAPDAGGAQGSGLPAGISKIAVNPRTGARVGWNGTAWVKLGGGK